MTMALPNHPPRGASRERVVQSEAIAEAQERPDFAALYDRWFDEVACWLRALGAPAADHEDLAQEVFLVVRRRLVDFDHRNVAGWLYRIASRQVASHRRRKWFKNLLARARNGHEDVEIWGTARDNPADLLEQKQRRQILESLLERMSVKRRSTFILYEIEGYSGEEIARLQAVPLATVWTRLHHARKELYAMAEDLRQREGG